MKKNRKIETVSEKDKNDFLDAMLKEDERYDFKIYGTIEGSLKEAMPYGLLGAWGPVGSGVGAAMGAAKMIKFCYMGATKKNVNFVVVDKSSPKIISEKIILPISEISKVHLKRSFIRSQTIVIFKMIRTDKKGKKVKIKFRANSFLIGADIENQKEGVEAFKEFVKNFW